MKTAEEIRQRIRSLVALTEQKRASKSAIVIWHGQIDALQWALGEIDSEGFSLMAELDRQEAGQ